MALANHERTYRCHPFNQTDLLQVDNILFQLVRVLSYYSVLFVFVGVHLSQVASTQRNLVFLDCAAKLCQQRGKPDARVWNGPSDTTLPEIGRQDSTDRCHPRCRLKGIPRKAQRKPIFRSLGASLSGVGLRERGKPSLGFSPAALEQSSSAFSRATSCDPLAASHGRQTPKTHWVLSWLCRFLWVCPFSRAPFWGLV